MKQLKKSAVFLLALIMMLTLSITAFAAQEGSLDGGSITISHAVPGETYDIYQLLYLESYDVDGGQNGEGAYAYKANSAWGSWLDEQDEYTAGEVLERAAQCHTDCHTGRGKQGDERAGLYAKDGNDNDDEEEQQGNLYYAEHERREGTLNVAADKDFLDTAVNAVDDEFTYIEYDDGSHQFQREVNGSAQQFLKNLVNRHMFQLRGEAFYRCFQIFCCIGSYIWY